MQKSFILLYFILTYLKITGSRSYYKVQENCNNSIIWLEFQGSTNGAILW